MDLINVFDYEKKAKLNVEKMAFDYIVGGSLDEATLSRNRTAFQEIKLKQFVLRDVSKIDLSQTILNTEHRHPIILGPVSLHQLSHPRGEIETAEGAFESNTTLMLSSLSSTSLEDVAGATDGEKWFQLYWYKNRELTKDMVGRAESSGYKAICLTVDAPVIGHREKDTHNRFTLPKGVELRNFTSTDQKLLPKMDAAGSGLAKYIHDQFDSSVSWKNLEWLQGLTNLPIMLKGVQTSQDAKLCLDHGIDGIVVSNHGGRQLDGSLSTIECLPRISSTIKCEIDILLDSGIRRGSDIFKAIALGAKGVLLGRAYIWGLGANGKAGVKHVIQILQDELAEIMALVGCTSVKQITKEFLEEKTIPNF